MKNIMLILLLLIVGSRFETEKQIQKFSVKQKNLNLEHSQEKTIEKIFKVTGTVYNPVSSQCDSDPLITADNSKIDLEKLKKGEIKWIAISRDLRKHFKYGETVVIKCKSDPTIDGEYEVRDTMHPRWKNKIDFLTYDRKLGLWKDIEMKKRVI